MSLARLRSVNGVMGFHVRCRCTHCDLRFKVDSGVEFYLSADGVEKPFDSVLPGLQKSEFAGLRGYWDFKVCPRCFLEYRQSTYLNEDGTVTNAPSHIAVEQVTTCRKCGSLLLDSHKFLEKFEDRIRTDYDEALRECRIKLASATKTKAMLKEYIELVGHGETTKIDLPTFLARLQEAFREKVVIRAGQTELLPLPDQGMRVLLAGNLLGQVSNVQDIPCLLTALDNLANQLTQRVSKLDQEIAGERRLKRGVACPQCKLGEIKYKWFIS
ncbi:MAG: hypothetical protein AB1489_04575 [Acidobacteriota bacterium]